MKQITKSIFICIGKLELVHFAGAIRDHRNVNRVLNWNRIVIVELK